MLIKNNLPEAEVLKRLIDRLYEAKDRENAFRAFNDAVGDVGFHGAMLVSEISGPGWREEITETTYPETWIAHYLASGYQRTDPTRKYGLSMRRAFFWSELFPRIRKKEMRVFNEAKEFGLVSGVTIPLYEGPDMVGGIGIASSGAEVEDPRLLTTLGIAGQVFLSVYEEIARRELGQKGSNNDHVLFTKAEMDILSRMSLGATNKEIADAMHIGLSSVEYHVMNILKKLKVKNRVSAVVMAIKLGIIELK